MVCPRTLRRPVACGWLACRVREDCYERRDVVLAPLAERAIDELACRHLQIVVRAELREAAPGEVDRILVAQCFPEPITAEDDELVVWPDHAGERADRRGESDIERKRGYRGSWQQRLCGCVLVYMRLRATAAPHSLNQH